MQSLDTQTYADPKVMADPFSYFERLRDADPVHYDEGIKTWLVTRHDDILTAARDTEGLSDQMRVSAAIRSLTIDFTRVSIEETARGLKA